MGRKSKQAGSGHFPLTHHERQEYSKEYGTTKARLSSVSQYSFGQCALSLHPAKEQPVATPSGFIYERSAILEYLLTQTQKLKQQQTDYEHSLERQTHKQSVQDEKKRKASVDEFENSQKVVAKKPKIDAVNPLKRTSYWLSEFQPETDDTTDAKRAAGPAPPTRPESPMSRQPLRRKDLIPLDLKFNSNHQVVCAISEKSIVMQQALALIPKKSSSSSSSTSSDSNKAQVVLEQVYNDLGKETICPVTGKKLSKILKLQRGGSSFAANGGVIEAQTYRPCMS